MSFVMKEAEAANTTRLSSRVTKPPGGECSDIFNTANSTTTTPPTTPRKKNHMQSNIFTPSDPATPSLRARPSDDSFRKLFGEMAVSNGSAETTKPAVVATNGNARPLKGHEKSSIIFSAGEHVKNGTTENEVIVNGSGSTPKAVIGDTHDSASSSGNSSGCATPNGSTTPNGSVNGDIEHRSNGTNGTGTPANGTPRKQRVPPGGHSTKLW